MRFAAVVVGIMALLTVAAGCGGSGESSGQDGSQSLDAVLASIDGLDAAEREAKLVELAAAEGGTLLWYSSMSERNAEDVVKAFKDAYGIDVQSYHGQGGEVFQRATEEASAGAASADVLYIGNEFVQGLDDKGLLGPYAPLTLEGLPEGSTRPGWFGVSTSITGVTWNTDLVKPDDVPTSWEQLADPRWKGQVAIDPSDADWYYSLFKYWVANGKSEEEAQQLFEQIAANAVFVKGHSGQAQLLGAGDISLGVNFPSIIEDQQSDGAPVAWKPPVEPLIIDFTGASVLARAPHPASAVLFVDWLLSDDGKRVLEGVGQLPPSTLQDLGFNYFQTDSEDLSAHLDEWETRFEQLISLGTSIEAP